MKIIHKEARITPCFFLKPIAVGMNTAAPAKISAGQTSRFSCGIIMGSIPSAPAGGISSPVSFIRTMENTAEQITAAVRSSAAMHRAYLSVAPAGAQAEIMRTVFTGVFRAADAGFENSVKATGSGGAMQNVYPKCISGSATTAPQIPI